ncbi:type II secretion system F family protein [Ferruginivarius sediminum]|uniref:Pilus assembly protein TadB n=1 Tax=Ferruginivarius sediminum TaxID=2661937 RepID=A0A369TBK0_9PROT|nr:type II secretion system F family protein [Ferruginivarius sediminum]RDD62693.1 pilus assembly protein TadB [Ferruginivarius sediminum]
MPVTPELAMVAVFMGVLVVFGLTGLLMVLFGGDRQRKRRLERAAGHKAPAGAMNKAQASLRRDEDGGGLFVQLLRKAIPGHRSLSAKLSRTGYDISISRYLTLSAAVAAVAALALFIVLKGPIWLVVAGGLFIGWLLPRITIGILAARRVNRFLLELPDAIDVMVRGLKSGLPVTEMIDNVGQDFEGPVGQEFRNIADNIRFGRAIEEALWSVAERLDIPEFNFLAISVGVQRESGGNLTETLRNLSSLLRQRQQMRLKVKALSSEARASAYIVGALPFIMLGLMFLLNAEYIGRLFEDPRGHWMLGGALASEMFGAFVMFKMVRFEI